MSRGRALEPSEFWQIQLRTNSTAGGRWSRLNFGKFGYAPGRAVAEPTMTDQRQSDCTHDAAKADGRRGFLAAVGFTSLGAVLSMWVLAAVRFMFPNTVTEPPTRFKVGRPEDFAPDSVDERFKADQGVWIVNTLFEGRRRIVALRAVCTHLRCTPNWLSGQGKFKCPCHGSGFDVQGINHEGPAPRPLERFAISVGQDGQIEVDKSRTFRHELGEWDDPESFVPG